MYLFAIFSIIFVIYQLLKEAGAPTLTAEHWANQELKHKDEMSGMSAKEILKNAEKGRYYIQKRFLRLIQKYIGNQMEITRLLLKTVNFTRQIWLNMIGFLFKNG